MAEEAGKREVPDSEDEPMTSSPVRVSHFDVHKLFSPPSVPLQERQDTLQVAQCSHQAHAKGPANTASNSAEGLGANPNNASVNVDLSQSDAILVAQQETATTNPDMDTVIPASIGMSRTKSRDEALPTNLASTGLQQSDEYATVQHSDHVNNEPAAAAIEDDPLHDVSGSIRADPEAYGQLGLKDETEFSSPVQQPGSATRNDHLDASNQSLEMQYAHTNTATQQSENPSLTGQREPESRSSESHGDMPPASTNDDIRVSSYHTEDDSVHGNAVCLKLKSYSVTFCSSL